MKDDKNQFPVDFLNGITCQAIHARLHLTLTNPLFKRKIFDGKGLRHSDSSEISPSNRPDLRNSGLQDN